jgi:uncharacterized membrane protein
VNATGNPESVLAGVSRRFWRGPALRDLAFLAAVVVMVLWPLAATDWWDSHEGVRYLLRLDALQQNVIAQGTHPRWIPECAAGRGIPYFTYYAPGFAYLCLPFVPLGQTAAVKCGIVLVTLAGALAAFALGARWGGRAGGHLAALLAVASPYPIFNLYMRGDLAEYAANHLAVGVLWLVWRVATGRGGLRAALGAGLLHGLMITQHNISALLFTGTIVVFGAGMGVVEHARGRAWALLALVPLTGVMVSAWFWAPSLLQLSLVSMAGITTGTYEPAGNLSADPQWVWRITRSAPVLGPLLTGAVLAVFAGAVAGRIHRARGLFLAGGIAALLLLTQPVSAWFWRHVPLVEYVQFPWRLMGPATVMAALAAAHLPRLAPRGPWRRAAGLAPAALALATALGLAVSFRNIPPDTFPVEARRISYWMTEPWPGNQYHEPMTAGEFAPITADPYQWPAFAGRMAMAQDAGGPVVLHAARRGAELAASLDGRAGAVMLAQFWHPTWRASVDGAPIHCQAGPGGCVSVSVPERGRELRLWPVRTNLETAAESVSALAVAVIVVFMAALSARRRARNRDSGPASVPPLQR